MSCRVAAVVLAMLGGCACANKPAVATGSGGSGAAATGCDGIRPRVEALYRADTQASEPKQAEASVADNTAMVMADCAKAPTTVVTCVQGASSVKELEAKCLPPLDDDGTEGDALIR